MEQLSEKEFLFLTEYLQTGSKQKARKKAGVSDRQAVRYLADEDFQAVLREYKRKILYEVVFRLQIAGGKAVTSLENVLDDTEASPTAKVTASRAILEYMYKGIEITSFADRLQALEVALNDEQGHNKELQEFLQSFEHDREAYTDQAGEAD